MGEEKKIKKIVNLNVPGFIGCSKIREGLNDAISAHATLLEKTLKLKKISGLTIDQMIDLYLKGYSITMYKIGVDISLDEYVLKSQYRELEKEVERLNKIEKDYNWRIKASNKEILKRGYIPKEAIREKIKELELQRETGVETFYDGIHINGEIFALKELLGE